MPPGPTPLWGPGAVPGKWADVCGFLKPPRCRSKMESTSAWCILHPPRSSWYPLDWPELPSRGLAAPWLCRMSQRTITSRKTRSKDPLERTFCAVPLRQTEGTRKRCYERPFAFFVISRPFAHVRSALPTTWATRVSSPSDLMTLHFVIRQSHVIHSHLVVDHPHCMHDHVNTACHQKKWALDNDTGDTQVCSSSQIDHFALWLPIMEINMTFVIWSLCRVYNGHCTSMKWLTTWATYKLKFQKRSWRSNQRHVGTLCGYPRRISRNPSKMRSRARKEAWAQKVRGY